MRSKFIVTIQIPSRDWTQNEKDVQPEWRPVCLACTIDLMWEGLLGNSLPINQLSRRTALTYSQFAHFHCVNISTTAEFMIPTWGHWTRKECAQLALEGGTSWLHTPLARPWYVFKWDGRCLCWHIYESVVKISSWVLCPEMPPQIRQCVNTPHAEVLLRRAWYLYSWSPVYFGILPIAILGPLFLFYTCCLEKRSHFNWCTFYIFPSYTPLPPFRF